MEAVSSVRTVTRLRAGNRGNSVIARDEDFALPQELQRKEPGKDEDHVKMEERGLTGFKYILRI